MPPRDEKIIDVEFDAVLHETARAWLIAINDKEVWFPKSLVEVDEDDCVITLPERIAIDKEIV